MQCRIDSQSLALPDVAAAAAGGGTSHFNFITFLYKFWHFSAPLGPAHSSPHSRSTFPFGLTIWINYVEMALILTCYANKFGRSVVRSMTWMEFNKMRAIIKWSQSCLIPPAVWLQCSALNILLKFIKFLSMFHCISNGWADQSGRPLRNQCHNHQTKPKQVKSKYEQIVCGLHWEIVIRFQWALAMQPWELNNFVV